MNIKTVEMYKYLGVTLHENLDFRESGKELHLFRLHRSHLRAGHQ